ncbi:MAG: HdeD family acid-resistance protein [Gemmataceae bacterium]|nr:HdeD family acid-resistance protein [Gemmataceae bacterium]
MSTNPLLGELEHVRRNWGWYLVLGIALIVLGIFALTYSVVTTVVSVMILGWVLIFSGIAQAVQAFKVIGSGGAFLHLLGGILEVVVGVIAVLHPLQSALALTLILAVYLLVGGLFRLFAALMLAFPGWGWVALGGGISALLGVALVAQWPWDGLWFLGICVGIDLILNGSAWIAFALGVRRVPQMSPGADTSARSGGAVAGPV